MPSTDTSPVLARRILAKKLRELRFEAGYTSAEEVAAALGWSKMKVTRWEQGHLTLPKPTEIDRVLTLYGATDAQRAEVAELVKHARRPGWWRAYNDVTPKVYAQYIGLEDAATSLRVYDGHEVPALLATADYCRAAIAGRYWRADPSLVERLTQVRLNRQRRLNDSTPVALWAIVEEGALRRPVAPAAVMREQYRHLLDLPPNVQLQVMPATVGAHPAVGPFVVMDYGGVTDEVALVPTPSGGTLIHGHDDIVAFRKVFEALIPLALSVESSQRFIEKLISDL